MTPSDVPGTGPRPELDGDARLIRALLSTPYGCRWLGSAIPEILKVVAGEGRLKGLLARCAGRRIRSGCVARAKRAEEKHPGPLDKDAGISMQMSGLAVGFLNQSMAAFNCLPGSEKKILLAHLADGLDTAEMGRLLTELLEMAQEDGSTRDLLRDKLTDFIESTDFGELADAAAGSRQRLLPLLEEAVDLFWSYPSKVVCLLSVVPQMAGFVMDAADRGLAPFNRLPPDMLVDVIVSLLGDVDGSAIGALINQAAELVCKIQVGSTLIGSPGRPELPQAVDRLMESILDAVDQDRLAVALGKMDLLKEALAEKRVDRLEQRPEWNAGRLKVNLKHCTRQARAFTRQVRRWEAIPADEDLARTVAEGFSDLDAGELADACNRYLDLAGRVMNVRPDLVPNLIAAFADEIDVAAIAHCLTLASPPAETGVGLADLATPLIHRLADQVETDPDSELADALRRLGRHMSG